MYRGYFGIMANKIETTIGILRLCSQVRGRARSGAQSWGMEATIRPEAATVNRKGFGLGLT